MAQKQTPSQWLQKLPDNTCSIRIRCGTGRSVPTVAVLALEGAKVSDKASEHTPERVGSLEEMVERTEEVLRDAGYPEESPRVRIHAHGSKGGELRSIQYTHTGGPTPGSSQEPVWTVVRDLTNGLLAACAENRKVVDILSETLAHRESVMAEALEAAMEYRMHMQDAQLHQAVAEMSIPDDAPEEDGFSGAATRLLEQVASQMMGGGTVDAATLRDLVNEDPTILDDLVQDDELVGRVFTAYQARRAATPEDGAGDPEPVPPDTSGTGPVIVDIDPTE